MRYLAMVTAISTFRVAGGRQMLFIAGLGLRVHHEIPGTRRGSSGDFQGQSKRRGDVVEFYVQVERGSWRVRGSSPLIGPVNWNACPSASQMRVGEGPSSRGFIE